MAEQILGPDTLEFDSIANEYKIFAPVRTLTSEDGMNKVIAIGEDPKLVLKTPLPKFGRNPAKLALHEGLVLCHLEEDAPTPPPVTIPRLYTCDVLAKQPNNLLSFVPGEILGDHTIDILSPAERQQLGRDLGSFVVWMTEAMAPKTLDIISDEVGFEPITLQSIIKSHIDNIHFIEARRYHNLVEVLYELDVDLTKSTQPEEPKIVGHNDLKPANLTFAKDKDGLYKLAGVIDFGVVRTNNINYEMRKILFMGEDILETAMTAYETATGISPSPELILLYLRAQVVGQVAFFAMQGMVNYRPELSTKMKKLFPERDWTELEAKEA